VEKSQQNKKCAKKVQHALRRKLEQQVPRPFKTPLTQLLEHSE
jgi:hypothetical protein